MKTTRGLSLALALALVAAAPAAAQQAHQHEHGQQTGQQQSPGVMMGPGMCMTGMMPADSAAQRPGTMGGTGHAMAMSCACPMMTSDMQGAAMMGSAPSPTADTAVERIRARRPTGPSRIPRP